MAIEQRAYSKPSIPDSKEIDEKINNLVRPKPADPSVPGDRRRYARELLQYKVMMRALHTLKQEADGIREVIEMATNPQKRRELSRAFQKLPENAEKLAALQKILESTRS